MPSNAKPVKRPVSKKRQVKSAAVTAAPDSRVTLSCCLARNADALLFLGNHLAAERLSLRAQALREAGR